MVYDIIFLSYFGGVGNAKIERSRDGCCSDNHSCADASTIGCHLIVGEQGGVQEQMISELELVKAV